MKETSKSSKLFQSFSSFNPSPEYQKNKKVLTTKKSNQAPYVIYLAKLFLCSL